MGEAGLDAVLVYTNFPRPAAVSWLSHFVPYWSQGVLVVLPAGPPLLLVSLSKRVAGWIEETAHVDRVICTPALGRSAAELLRDQMPGGARVGIVEMAKLPGGIGHPLQDALDGVAMEDASALFAAIRHPADDPEIAVSEHAAAIARNALDGVAASVSASESVGAVIAAVEGAARLAGAEEVIIAIAPDIASDQRFRRIEGDVALAGRFALRLSLAYKGHWVRLVGSFVRDGGGPGPEQQVQSWLARGLPGLAAGADAETALRAALPDSDGLRLAQMDAEACTGCAPLSRLDSLPAGAVVSVTLTIESADGVWLVGAPVLTGTDGAETRLLYAG
jgi:hypothetical protein